MQSNSEESPTANLFTDVRLLPGVGSGRGELLARLGIRRAVDLLFFFPKRYEDPTPLVTSKEFEEKQKLSFVATVVEMEERYTTSGKHMLGVLVEPKGGGFVRLVWFNQPFRKADLNTGRLLIVSGTIKSTGLNWEIVQPKLKFVASEDQIPQIETATGPQPIYPLTEGINQDVMRNMMRQALPVVIGAVEEALPEEMRNRLDVPQISDALNWAHFPNSTEDATRAMRRFKLQELLVLQLAIAIQRHRREISAKAPVCSSGGKVHARILNRLPFQLTNDQSDAVLAIQEDMRHDTPMNRLLQGDVGSGKTIVAQYAMMLAVANGYQAALLAPTEVLAQQHYRTLKESLLSSRVESCLVTGGLSTSERREVNDKIASGNVDLIVGTQALLSRSTKFANLGLVVVDEQHKFGVKQRAVLRTKDSQPHYLVLSATPIPRTIAMTSFGDLDISTIRSKPPGRAKIHSYVTSQEELPKWWEFVDQQLEQGRQAFVIAPRVRGKSEKNDLATATGTYAELCNGPFKHRSLGLLHGQLSTEEKEEVLLDFAAGTVDLLVSTTVVEVGINVPNATIMTVLDANRMGLSQLHQLRGRIGRGTHAGYACAVASKNCDETNHDRLKAFAASDDGFELAEIDMRLRGPGDLLGTMQSGTPTLRVADLVADADLVAIAQTEARTLLENDPDLDDPNLSKLVSQTLRRYGKSMALSDIG